MDDPQGTAPRLPDRFPRARALAVLSRADPKLRPPRRWFVLDEQTPGAAAYTDTLMLTRGPIESGHLEPVLAHELGHPNSADARLTAALRRAFEQ